MTLSPLIDQRPAARIAPAIPSLAPARSATARAASYALLLLFWGASISLSIAQTLTMSRRVAVEGVKTAISQPVVDAWYVGFLVPAIIAVLVLLFRVVFVRNDLVPLLVTLTPWIWINLNEFTRGNVIPEQTILPIGVALTFWAIQPRVSDLKLYALLATILAAVSMALTSSAPTLMYMPQSFDEATEKSITGLPLLAGFFSHPNANGLFLVLALPLTYLFSRWYLRWITAGVILTAIVWTSSRTALFGAAVWLVVMLLSLAVRRRIAGVLGVVLAILMVAVVVVPVTTTDPEAYTERGAIWQFNLAQLSGLHWVFGLGHNWYTDNYPMLKSALSSAAGHGHNVFVTYTVTGGLILVSLIAVVVVFSARTASRLPDRERVGAFAFLCVLAGVSITESAWRVEAPDTLFAAMLVPIFIIATQSSRVPADEPRFTGGLTGESAPGSELRRHRR